VRAAAALLVLALAAAPLHARADAGKAAAALSEVNRELASGEFERALKKADAALKKVTDPTEVAQLQLARGQALLAMGRADKARAAFVLAVQKDPTVELDAGRSSPDALNLFNKARAEFPATVAIAVSDGEAGITIDDKDLGPSPLQLQLGAGSHLIVARAKDGRTARKEIRVIPGKKLEVQLELGAPPGPAEPPPATATAKEPPKEAPAEPPPAVTAARPVSTRSWLGLAPAAGGAAVLIGGALCLWQARVQYDRLVSTTLPPLSATEEQAAVGGGRTLQALGWVGVSLGVAAMAAGAAMLLFLQPKADAPVAQLGAAVAPDGSVWVGVSGRWP